jgi:alanine dehydrogenase
MPSAYSRTATQALTNVTHPYVERLADFGAIEACRNDPALASGLSCHRGELMSQIVAEAHGLPFTPFQSD